MDLFGLGNSFSWGTFVLILNGACGLKVRDLVFNFLSDFSEEFIT
jgi:hypothetical protein